MTVKDTNLKLFNKKKMVSFWKMAVESAEDVDRLIVLSEEMISIIYSDDLLEFNKWNQKVITSEDVKDIYDIAMDLADSIK
jgi:hypothetical protein